MNAIAETASSGEIYLPKRAFRLLAGIGLLGAGAFVSWVAVGSGVPLWLNTLILNSALLDSYVSGVTHRTVLTTGDRELLLLFALMCLSLGLWRLVEAIRGLPRLVVTSEGVALQTIFATKWANWVSVENFELKQERNKTGQVKFWASASIGRADASERFLRGPSFKIPDAFLVPLPALIADLNARRAQAMQKSP
jgi:hypothetical protein